MLRGENSDSTSSEQKNGVSAQIFHESTASNHHSTTNKETYTLILDEKDENLKVYEGLVGIQKNPTTTESEREGTPNAEEANDQQNTGYFDISKPMTKIDDDKNCERHAKAQPPDEKMEKQTENLSLGHIRERREVDILRELLLKLLENEYIPSCSICTFKFGGGPRTPQVLKCGHSFCRSCVTQCIVSHEKRMQSEPIPCPFPCPTCRVTEFYAE